MILNKLLFISSLKHTLFIALFFILSSCSSYYNYESDFIGLYIRNYHSYGIGASMELKKNKVFEYHWQQGLWSGVTKGTWKKSGRHIVFNSELQPILYNYSVIVDSKKGSQDSLSIRILDNDKLPMPLVVIRLVNKDKEIIFNTLTDFDGLAKLPKASSDSIKLIMTHFSIENIIRDYPKNSYPFISIPDSTVGHYQFQINMGPSRKNCRYFTDEKWKYKNSKFVGVKYPFSKKEKGPKVDFKRKNYRIVLREKKKKSDSTIIRVFDFNKEMVPFFGVYLYKNSNLKYVNVASNIHDPTVSLPTFCSDNNYIRIKAILQDCEKLIISSDDWHSLLKNKRICDYDIDVFWLIPERFEIIKV